MRRIAVLLSFALAACASTQDAQKGDAKATDDEDDKGSKNISQTAQGNEKVTEFDLNGDKKPDVWAFTVPGKTAEGKDFDRLARKELDLNWDGKVDVARAYDEKEAIIREALDLDFDGKIDQVNHYEKSVIVRK